MHKYCKQCADKKHIICTVMNLEEVGSNNNAVIVNEGNITITNEKIFFK